MRALVCGGAGYIGAHMCRLLAAAGHEVFVFDDLSTGHEEAVCWGRLLRGELQDAMRLAVVFDEVAPEWVFHFAAKSVVAESVAQPDAYYRSNVFGSHALLEQVRRLGARLIFSSTAATYGRPTTPLLAEDHPQRPINAYGRTKLAIEFLLQDYWAAYGVGSVSFRYFNAAGAAPGAGIGESHAPETHLIPRLLESALGRLPPIAIYGRDYATRDGTCVRDYVHVDDICAAHLAAMGFLTGNPGAHVFNLGCGSGFSVREVVAAASRVVGQAIRTEEGPRRPGDPDQLVADSRQARGQLGWTPATPELEAIIETAWRWHRDRRF